jgi:uracil phosphoribosyltransferase
MANDSYLHRHRASLIVPSVGMYRSHTSRLPVQYYNRLPKNEKCDVAFILDPCIATAETLLAVCSIVRNWGAKRIVVVAALGARAGVDKLLATHPDLEIYIGAIDETLSPQGMIVPGFGDAGDRLFGTPFEALSAQSDDHLAKKQKTDG